MKNRIFCLLLVLLSVLLAFAGCNDNAVADYDYYPGSSDSESYSYSASKKISSKNSSDVGVTLTEYEITDDSKVTRTVSATIKTETYTDSVNAVRDKAKALGGMVESENFSAYGMKSGSMTVLIPAEKLDEFTKDFSTFGVVCCLSSYVNDISEKYIAQAARETVLTASVAEYDAKLATLTEKADIATWNTLKKEKDAMVEELEQIKETRAYWNKKVSYSTVYLTLEEVKSEEAVVERTVGQRIKDTFASSIESIAENFFDFIVWFCGNIIGIVLWCGLLVGGFFLLRFSVRKRRAKQSKGKEEKADTALSEDPKND